VPYYVCPPLSVSISGPGYLDPNELGTFSTEVDGGTTTVSYQWYKWIVCDWLDRQNSASPDAPPCDRWLAFGNNQSSVQTSGQSDFKLKVKVTDSCYDARVVYSPEHYVTVGGALAKRMSQLDQQSLWVQPVGQASVGAFGSYPNPFNSRTVITFSLSRPIAASVVIYNIRGQKVKTLLPAQPFTMGPHTVVWDGRSDGRADVPSGVYLCRLWSRDGVKVLRIVLMR
jgi:hypothetical protein